MILNPAKCHYMSWQNVNDKETLNFKDTNIRTANKWKV